MKMTIPDTIRATPSSIAKALGFEIGKIQAEMLDCGIAIKPISHRANRRLQMFQYEDYCARMMLEICNHFRGVTKKVG